MFEIVDGRQRDGPSDAGAWVYYKVTMGELKSFFFSSGNCHL